MDLLGFAVVSGEVFAGGAGVLVFLSLGGAHGCLIIRGSFIYLRVRAWAPEIRVSFYDSSVSFDPGGLRSHMKLSA